MGFCISQGDEVFSCSVIHEQDEVTPKYFCEEMRYETRFIQGNLMEKIECWELSSLKVLQVLLYVFWAAKWVTAVKNIVFDISYNTGEDKGGEQCMRYE